MNKNESIAPCGLNWVRHEASSDIRMYVHAAADSVYITVTFMTQFW